LIPKPKFLTNFKIFDKIYFQGILESLKQRAIYKHFAEIEIYFNALKKDERTYLDNASHSFF